MKAISVVYDEQFGKYYRVDKETGQMKVAEKNGELPKQFKHQYTGKDYHIRKQKEQSFLPSSITKPPFKVKLSPKNSMPDYRYFSKSASKTKSSLSTYNQQRQTEMKKYSTIDTLMQSKMSQGKFSQFSQRLKEFSNLRQNKINENHSPLKNVEGSQPIKSLLSLYQNKIISGLEQKKKRKTDKSQKLLNTLSLPQNLSCKKQVSRQKQIFFKYNPQLLHPENEKQLKQLRQRKINMKMLEKLSLEQNDRITRHIYQ